MPPVLSKNHEVVRRARQRLQQLLVVTLRVPVGAGDPRAVCEQVQRGDDEERQELGSEEGKDPDE